jgi:hypothetical protein
MGEKAALAVENAELATEKCSTGRGKCRVGWQEQTRKSPHGGSGLFFL